MDNKIGAKSVDEVEVACTGEDDSHDGNAVRNERGKSCSLTETLQVKAIVHSEPFCANAISSDMIKVQAENSSTISTLKRFNDLKSPNPGSIKTDDKLSNGTTSPKVMTEKSFDGHS